jgi:hypothetical protein
VTGARTSGVDQTPARLVPVPGALVAGGARTAGTVHATNWSGYADTGAVFTQASGVWTQPAVHCARAKLGFSAFWVGIDGLTSQTVEQTGTEAVCIGTQTAYDAFYELYPAAAVVLDTSTYPVTPGDTLTAQVGADSPTTFTVTLSSSRGWTYTATGSAPSAARSSAEWIAEAPSLCLLSQCRVLPLANFGTVAFTHASAISTTGTGSVSGFADDQIVMMTKKKVIRSRRARRRCRRTAPVSPIRGLTPEARPAVHRTSGVSKSRLTSGNYLGAEGGFALGHGVAVRI